MPELVVRYKHDGNNYEVFVAVKSQDVIDSAIENASLRSKQGEDLVSAFVALTAGSISMIGRSKNGRLNDGPNGEPAWFEFHENGVLNSTVRFKDGAQQDSAKGDPALMTFNYLGQLVRVEHYRDGQLHDGINGEPACQGLDGEGNIYRATRCENGKITKILNEQEMEEYQRQRAAPKKAQPRNDAPGL